VFLDAEEAHEVLAEQVRIHDSVAHTADIQRRQPPWMIKVNMKLESK